MTVMNFKTVIDWNAVGEKEQDALLMRPAVSASDKITAIVTDILKNVKDNGDDALREYNRKFDKTEVDELLVAPEAFDEAERVLPEALKNAMRVAVSNLTKFHTAQRLAPVSVETMKGIVCEQVTRPIDSVGLYIPGGTAPLFSTALMLLIPAKIAGCRKVVLCSPPPIAPEILFACRLCGVEAVYQVGGAQAVAAMAFGTESIPKVDKIV
ncbi:MAG: histidinol dehydrogenase, partial [Burkholderiaceae bacterium]|nr:histidinol dehydrogenase [Burkholderiaceae bacterium]